MTQLEQNNYINNLDMHSEQEALQKMQKLLKVEGPYSKRSLAQMKKHTSLQFMLSVRYPPYIIQSMATDKHIQAFLKELDSLTQSYCEQKQQRMEYFMRKACQNLFNQAEKCQLQKMIGEQFGQTIQTEEPDQQSGARKLYNLLHFIFGVEHQS